MVKPIKFECLVPQDMRECRASHQLNFMKCAHISRNVTDANHNGAVLSIQDRERAPSALSDSGIVSKEDKVLKTDFPVTLCIAEKLAHLSKNKIPLPMCSSDYNSLANSSDDIKNLLLKHSVSFVRPSGKNNVIDKVYLNPISTGGGVFSTPGPVNGSELHNGTS